MNLADVDWPDFGLADDVRSTLDALARAGRPAVIATLFAADGGSPRGVGTQMLIGEDVASGYLSGGCVEADVALHAAEVLATGQPRRLIYGEGGPPDVRLPCGGRIEVLLERVGQDDPAAHALLKLWRARRPALWLTNGTHRACLAPGQDGEDLPAPLKAALALAEAGGVCGEAESALFRRFDPPGKLIVIGADPPALAMAAMGAQVGLATTLIRPKGPTAPPPLAGVAYRREAPAEALRAIGLDPWTALAVATHEAELDCEALAEALPSSAGYVGVLGSRRRLPERLERLRALGLTDADLHLLHAPIGLPLAGKSPWEIAASVIAEIVQARRAAEAAQTWPARGPVQRLHAVVLAAGAARRYGAPKLLEPFKGGRVIDGALDAAFAAPAESVTLVTGSNAEAVAAAARAFAARRPDGARLRIVHATDHDRGLSASLKAGIAALPADAEAAFLFLGDMPRISKPVLPPLAEAVGKGAPAAAPAFEGRRGHPVLIARALFADLMALEGDAGAAPLLKALGADLALVPAPDDGVLFDVDAPADLQGA